MNACSFVLRILLSDLLIIILIGVSPCSASLRECTDETDAKKILTASPLENWRRPPGQFCTIWMKTIQQYITSP